MRIICLLATALAIVCLLYLGLSPSEAANQVLPSFLKDNDKLQHFLGFLVLSACIYASLEAGIAKSTRFTMGTMLVASVMGEVAQLFTRDRTPDFFDFLANIGGSIVGIALSVCIDLLRLRLLRKRKRARYSLVSDGAGTAHVDDEIPLQANGTDATSGNGLAVMKDEEMGIDD
ncbi:hypothetical protein SeMB42_g04172 [Synchytrium endobioticum]|uniref:VanZ-like domain-containing protein n=1 Tax=Synchytrium endobioticum TaxID=286115 RepID=A0A507DFJ7_9FUNG|nr:hypothetical protein SeMB42_g04172 [Synchytrium endobioticum]TPX50432.1 hypothetical protein SeLEV6574_g00905 [Synchytrium endobioticum]